jgi:hypothetical protein
MIGARTMIKRSAILAMSKAPESTRNTAKAAADAGRKTIAVAMAWPLASPCQLRRKLAT